MSKETKHAKIGIETISTEDDSREVEFAWADKVGDNLYQLKNFPFFAYGVSYDDIVEALPRYDDDPYPYLTKVVTKSGHRTLRVIFDEESGKDTETTTHLDELARMNCGYEGCGGNRLYVINVQPHCDYDAVRDYLNDNDLMWEYGDPTQREVAWQ